MAASLRTLALPFALISMLAGVLGIAAYAVQASAELDTSIEYAEYRNDRWHFSLTVPADLTVSVHDHDVQNGQTMLFFGPKDEYKFRISTWPYTQLDMTLAREGTPSTNADQPDHLEIVDVVRDDILTILFQKNGVRYVVATLPEYEAWLTEILKTWQFTD